MGSVKTGITLICWGLAAIIIAVICMAGITNGLIDREVERLPPTGMVLGCVLNIVGLFKCLSAPHESGARKFIIITIIFACISLPLFLVDHLRKIHILELTIIPEWAILLYEQLFLAGFIFFILFIKQLMLFIQREDLALIASSVLTLGIILIATSFLTIALLYIEPMLIVAARLTMLVIGILLAARYLVLIFKLRNAI